MFYPNTLHKSLMRLLGSSDEMSVINVTSIKQSLVGNKQINKSIDCDSHYSESPGYLITERLGRYASLSRCSLNLESMLIGTS